MGPFSNQTPPTTPPDRGNKLPIPDVEAAQAVIVIPERDSGVRRWFQLSMIIIGALAVAGIVVFAVYAYMTSTPRYMLSAAMTNFVTSNGQAGDFTYDIKGLGDTQIKFEGDFLAFSDPSNPENARISIGVGRNSSRVGANMLLFGDGNSIQFSGLGNIERLAESFGADGLDLSDDTLAQLSGLDGQWYEATSSDDYLYESVAPGNTLDEAATSKAIEAIAQSYTDHQFLVVKQQFADEDIDGVKSMHIQLGIDRDILVEYLRAIKDASDGALITDDQIDAAAKSDEYDKVTIEAWIARSDRTFRQVMAKISPVADSDAYAAATVLFRNEEVAAQRRAIVRPESAKHISSFIERVWKILLTNTPTSAQ